VGESWRVDVHPPRIAASPGITIEEARKQKPEWIRPDLHIPSDTDEFQRLARQIVGDRKRVREAAVAIQNYVYRRMRPNAGIGVLRNASEVLETREGVCRDYAILTATLMRSAGVPTRLASGLVNWDGDFYYHAWVEFWNGRQWIGLDSTTPREQISATTVKLASGNLEQTFTFTFLGNVNIEVLGMERAP
jgi:transglutaminase-like putative cysteine protease